MSLRRRQLLSFPTRRSSDLSRWSIGSPVEVICRSKTTDCPISSTGIAQNSRDGSSIPATLLHALQMAWGRIGDRKTTSVQAASIKGIQVDRKSTRLNSSHVAISYAVFCLKKKKKKM